MRYSKRVSNVSFSIKIYEKYDGFRCKYRIPVAVTYYDNYHNKSYRFIKYIKHVDEAACARDYIKHRKKGFSFTESILMHINIREHIKERDSKIKDDRIIRMAKKY